MKIRAPLVVPAIVVALAAGCQQPPMADYSSEDGKFKVRFPGQPKVTATGAAGMSIKMYMVEFWNKAYMVGWADVPIPEWESEGRTKSRLFDARDGALAAVKGKSNGTTHTILLMDKYPGVEFGGSADGKFIRARAYIVGRRLYQLLALGRDEQHLASAEVEEFFTSFELIDPAPPVPSADPAPPKKSTPAPTKSVVINSTGGKFKAKYPVSPKKGTRPVGDATFTTYAAEADGGACEVGYGDVPASAGDGVKLSARLDAARDAAVKSFGGEMAESKAVSLNWERPGREFTAALADGRHVRGRVYLSGSRVYQVAVSGAKEYTASKPATEFLDSFQITK
jgi:hypothetical protein